MEKWNVIKSLLKSLRGRSSLLTRIKGASIVGSYGEERRSGEILNFGSKGGKRINWGHSSFSRAMRYRI